jgi:hypothetical protein
MASKKHLQKKIRRLRRENVALHELLHSGEVEKEPTGHTLGELLGEAECGDGVEVTGISDNYGNTWIRESDLPSREDTHHLPE